MKRPAWFSLFAFIGVAVALAGCQPAAVPEGGRPNPKPVSRLVSLSPSTTEVIMAHRFDIQLVGRTPSCNFPEAVKNAPVVTGVKPNYEAIAAAKPDLVVYDSTLYNEQDTVKLRQLGLELWPMKVRTVDEFIDFLYRTGARIGGESEFSDYAEKILTARRTAQAQGTDAPRRVMIMLGEGGGEFLVAGRGSFTADMVRSCGYEVLGPDADRFVPINIEAILAENPDVILTSTDVARFTQDPRLKTLDAVTMGRVVRVNGDVLLRAGSRVDRFINDVRPTVEGLFKEGR